MSWTDRDIARACLTLYPAGYAITRWPEDSNRTTAEIDAYAEAPGHPPLAIEVTKIESFPDQQFDDRRIEELAKALEPIGRKFPTGVDVLVGVGSIRPGFDWQDAYARLGTYLADLRNRLEEGVSWHSVPDVPFRVCVTFEPELNTKFGVGRLAPADQTRRDALLESVTVALGHKAQKLREYREGGARSVLIMESGDHALISWVAVYAAYLKARERVDTTHLDDVWFCRINPHRLDEWYGFAGQEEVLERVNRPNFRLGPSYLDYWLQAIREGKI